FPISFYALLVYNIAGADGKRQKQQKNRIPHKRFLFIVRNQITNLSAATDKSQIMLPSPHYDGKNTYSRFWISVYPVNCPRGKRSQCLLRNYTLFKTF